MILASADRTFATANETEPLSSQRLTAVQATTAKTQTLPRQLNHQPHPVQEQS